MHSLRTLLRTPLWNRFTLLQLVVMALAAIPPMIIGGAVSATLLGLMTEEALISLALEAGENPGTLTFAAMFLASPVQWLTGRSQIRVRKYLGIVFFLLAFSNFAMFVLEQGLAASFGAPFLVAGLVALVVATPLFLTSSRWSQRMIGMRRWRLLHKLTYVVGAALLGHLVLLGEIDVGAILIGLGFVARLPVVSTWLQSRRKGAVPAAASDEQGERDENGRAMSLA